MIDWIIARLPIHHDGIISGGSILSYNPDGELEWETRKRLKVEGSYSSSLVIKSEIPGEFVWVSFNPCKFIQGHNVFGPDDLVPLICMCVEKMVQLIPDLKPTREDWVLLERGGYEISMIDTTAMVPLKRQGDVKAFILAASQLATSRYQGRAFEDGTVYLGKHSRRVALKMYNKFEELSVHQLPKEIPYRDEILKHAEPMVRIEIRWYSMELKECCLNVASNWKEHTPQALVAERIKTMNMPEKMKLTKATMKNLPGRLAGVYALWEDGQDLRSIYPKRTYYRYRRELLKHGIDINVPQPVKLESNVIPMVRYLVAEYRGNIIPDFAKGTPIYADTSTYVYKTRKVG